jgi:hypothetical protein
VQALQFLKNMDFLVEHAKGFGTLFYMVNPFETMFEKIEDLPHPNWTAQVGFLLSKILILHNAILLT